MKRNIAPDDPRLSDARHFAEQLANMIAVTPPDQPVGGLDRIPGADASNTVTCYVDAHGEIVDVSLRSDWWFTLGPSGIAAAVLDALAFAQEKSLITMAIVEQHGRQVDVREENPYTFLQTEDSPYRMDLETEVAEAYAKLRRTASIVDASDRIRRMRDTAKQRVIAGPRGLFRVTMAGFDLQQANVDESALSAADADLWPRTRAPRSCRLRGRKTRGTGSAGRSRGNAGRVSVFHRGSHRGRDRGSSG